MLLALTQPSKLRTMPTPPAIERRNLNLRPLGIHPLMWVTILTFGVLVWSVFLYLAIFMSGRFL